MVRPIVLVFQEFATQTVVPVIPDLNCLIVGPAYQIKDYLDDKVDLEVANYGTLNAAQSSVDPYPIATSLTISAPPGIEAGAWVDPDSINVIFDDLRAVIATGASATVSAAPADNTVVDLAATFETSGVVAGDFLLIRIGGNTLVRTVLAVDSETQLRVTSNLPSGATSRYRIERKLDDKVLDSSFVVKPIFRSSNEIEVLTNATVVVGTANCPVTYARVYVEYRAFRTDLQTLDTVDSTSQIQTKIGKIDARNPLAAACFVALQNAGQAAIQFYGVESDDLIGYNLAKDAISSDTSIYAIVPLTTDLNVIAAFKADCESLADPLTALSNGVPQKFRVVIGSGDLPVTKTLVEETSTATAEQLIGAVPPGTKRLTLASIAAQSGSPALRPGDQIVLSASENATPLNGTYTIAHINSDTEVELNESLPAVVAVAEGVNYEVTRTGTGTVRGPVDNRANGTNEDVVYYAKVAGSAPGARTIEKFQDATTPGGINSIVEVPGVSTVINGDFAALVLTAQDIVDAINTGTGVTVSFSGSVNLVATTAVPATAQNALGATALTALASPVAGVDDLTSTDALDDVFIRLLDSAATFITDGVLPGDYIEIPSDPNGSFGTTYKRFEVNQVLSEQRLEIVNISGGLYQNNTSIAENELPHYDNRLGTGTNVSNGTITYRVLRDLNKNQQVTELVTRAQSLNSRRALLAWPYRVTVAGLVDGSKPRGTSGTAVAADPQPGYYMASVIGGMTAGLPSHQGFSRLGIAGIGQMYGSTDYFSESQITQLSDGGWYVFVQDSPSALPYSVHQLTTDPSTLESGEYSIVKNFDFVSTFFAGILEPFLGVWNINTETLGFIRQALNTGIENLKLRRVARIGAPLNSASVTSVEISTASADRVEVFMQVGLPKPLNVIGLHLIA